MSQQKSLRPGSVALRQSLRPMTVAPRGPGLSEPEVGSTSTPFEHRSSFRSATNPCLGHGVAGPTSTAQPRRRPASSPTRGLATSGLDNAAQRARIRECTPSARNEPEANPVSCDRGRSYYGNRCDRGRSHAVAPGSPSPRSGRHRHRSSTEALSVARRIHASATEWPGPRQRIGRRPKPVRPIGPLNYLPRAAASAL